MSPKLVRKLADKKYRTETGLFIVEGDKNIRELLCSSFEITDILGTDTFLDAIIPLVNAYEEKTAKDRVTLRPIKADELARTGTFVTNDAGIAIAKQRGNESVTALLTKAQENIVLILDDIRDPGNLGTIIRIADWYGVDAIAASITTTDFYNPKTIAATMGSFTRITVTYLDLDNLLTEAQKLQIPIVAADMTGKSIHDGKLPRNGFLIMGSESHGVSKDALAYVTEQVTIPRFGHAESLNVSVATGIILDALRRKY